MTDFILDLQGMSSEDVEVGEQLASSYTTVLCGHSWTSITC
ncbi:SapB/AmfS family lanthipeptide [Streptomyces sulphureus]|nr:SapB/AmfS family lanthipeptide [Streptomyces sulphureus]